MKNRSRNVTADGPEKPGRGRPKLYDRRTTIGLSEPDYEAIERLRDEGESWEGCARRLLRQAIERESGRRRRSK
jgi:hypothetical protein